MRVALKKTLGFRGRASIGVKLRSLLTGLLFVGLAACDVPSIRTAGDASALNVQSINVDTSQLAVAVEGRESSITTAQLDTDLTAALTAALTSKNDPEGRLVQVNVTMESFRLAPPVERVVAGTSTAVGLISVTEVGTNAVIVPPTRVSGNSENFRGAWVLGLATTRSVDKDYTGTVNGFANTARTALFGPDQDG